MFCGLLQPGRQSISVTIHDGAPIPAYIVMAYTDGAPIPSYIVMAYADWAPIPASTVMAYTDGLQSLPI